MEQHIQGIVEAVADIKIDIASLRSEIVNRYVTKEEIKPLQRFVQGMQGAGVAILFGLIAYVIAHAIPGFNL